MPEDKNKLSISQQDLERALSTKPEGMLNSETGHTGPLEAAFGNTDFGESKYDADSLSSKYITSGDYNDIRGLKQTSIDQIANAIPRLASKVGTEVLKTPGYLYALGEAGLTNSTLAESLDNAYLNGLQYFDDKTKEAFPEYKPKSVRLGNLWDNITSLPFYMDEGVDGLGYLLSMTVPGAGLKAAGIAGKVAKLPFLTTAMANNIELGTATVLNTVLESSAEAKGIADNLTQTFEGKIGKEINPNTGQVWTVEEAKIATAEATKNSMLMNLGLLLVPNMIMNKNLLGRFNTSKTVLDGFKDATGRFVLNNPIAKKGALKDYLLASGEAIASEGFMEEAGQTTVENYNKKVALNQFNGSIWEGLAKEYVNTLTTTEGQKSILLGALMGAPGGVIGKYRERSQAEKDKSVLGGLIKENFEGFSTEMDKIIQKDEQGNVIFDPTTKSPKIDLEAARDIITNLVKEQQSTNLQDVEALKGNKDMYDYIFNQQLSRFALPYIKQEGGIDVLNQHIDDLSKKLTDANKNSHEVNLEESTFRNETKKQVKDLEKVFKSVQSSIDDANLDELSKDPKDLKTIGIFANKLAFTAYTESSKQLFLSKKIKELNHEVMALEANAAEIPQFTIEREKLVNRIESLNKSLELSKENYKAIFDKKQQELAFTEFSKKQIKEQKEVAKAIKKEATKPKPSEHVEEPDVDIANTQDPGTITDLDSLVGDIKTSTVSQEDIDAEKDNAFTLLHEALQTDNLEHFNIFKKELSKSSVLTTGQKKELQVHEEKLKALAGTTTVDNDDELVGTYLNTNTIASDEVTNEQKLVSPKEVYAGKFKDLARSASKRANAVMMHIFNHKFVGERFTWSRDKEGLPVLDNASNVNIEALNAIQIEDSINFKYVTPSKEQLEKIKSSIDTSKQAIKEHIEDGNLYDYSTDKDYGFDDKHIGIYNDANELLGFVQLPHAISGLVEGDTLNDYKDARNALIEQRQFIISQLDKGEVVSSKITEKGAGSLYTKLTSAGKIDPINHIFNSIREQDKISGNAVFAYIGNTGDFVLPKLEDPDQQDIIEIALANLKNWGKPGAVYQLVKATNDEWYPVPVYSNMIDDKVAKQIVKDLSKLPENTPAETVVRILHPFILTSTTKGSLIVKKEGDNTKITINGEDFTLGAIQNARKSEFINLLKTKRQNIDIKNINSRFTQSKLKERTALLTNATTYKGEYLVQPYLEYDNLIEASTVAKDEDAELNVTTPEVSSDVSREELLKSRGIKPEDFEDTAFSRPFNSYQYGKLDEPKVKAWLKKNLPGLTLSEVRHLSDLKTNISDAVGMYRDMTIHLFQGASDRTAYHEAFHGVFRNMLSASQRIELIEEAKRYLPKPKQSDLDYLQEGYARAYSPAELTYLYYEEALADIFGDFVDTYKEPSLGQKIKDFFNRILEFFGIFTKNDQYKVDELYHNIVKGKYAKKSIRAAKDFKLVNRKLRGYDSNDYVFSRIKGFTATFKSDRVKSIGNSFIAEYQKQINAGNKGIKPSDIYNSIFKQYKDIEKRAINDASISNTTLINTIKVIDSFPELRSEATKYLGNLGIKVKDGNIEYVESTVTDEEEVDDEVSTLNGTTTKGFNEWISIPGLKSASSRLKLFLASIPVTENHIEKHDAFGFPIFHDFNKLYYYIERNLTGVYDFDSQLAELDRLSINRPELLIVKQRLLAPTIDMTAEELKLLQNDFKSNFSKQQLSYSLVKFDTDSATGEVTFKIMDANRQDVGREIYDEWTNNLINPARNTIAEFNQEGEPNVYGTKKSKEVAKFFNSLKGSKKLDYTSINENLLLLGIEYAPEVLKEVINKQGQLLINTVIKVANWYASDNPADFQAAGRKAMSKLVRQETTYKLNNYTQSFNNVENKSIYTVQLPSFASKLISKLTSPNANIGYGSIEELEKDESYKYSNLLQFFKENNEFRVDGFRLNYLDGLKDERGNSKGSKFTNMSPKDFMAMQIALFNNSGSNESRITSETTHKYVYITPSDKTMSMIFDANKYDVNIDTNGVKFGSEIIEKFYNVFLQEAARVKQQLIVKDKVMKGEISPNQLIEHYHYAKKNPPVKRADGSWDLEGIKWNGQAFKFNHFSNAFNKMLYSTVESMLSKNPTADLAEMLDIIKDFTVEEIIKELNNEIKDTYAEAIDKGVIKLVNGQYENIALDKTTSIFKNAKSQHEAIRQTIAEFSLNTWLFNIEASKLLNGDIAQYKPGDIQKRTYQSGSMTIMGNTAMKPKIRTKVVKDYIADSTITDDPDYKKINVTDAQVYISPSFYKSIHEMRGTWNDSKQLAYDIAEGIIKNPSAKQLEEANQELEGVKPFYFGNRFDETLGIHRYEQVKCAMLPLFKSYTDMNPLLADKRAEMDNKKIDMIAHESAMKAAIGYREDIDTNGGLILDLDTNNFGIQVDNPNHSYDSTNDSMRQLKMLLLGNIDTDKEYNGRSGKDLQKEINAIEGTNTRQDLDKLKKLINNPTDNTFKNLIREKAISRGVTENAEQLLSIIDGNFQYPLDNGILSNVIENLISAIFTDKVIKQEFQGGSAVQATALGLKYSSFEEQQKAIEANPELYKMQSDLKWVRPGKGDKVEYAEAIMPAWSSKFFNSDGTMKTNIPDNLKELLIYRIPTEGYHSMLPIKVVKFLPRELGNFIMLPYEITKQFGADFDFDKIYFINPEFTEVDGKLSKVEFDSSKSITENSRAARNNRILDNYMSILSSKETLPLLMKPSGFDALVSIKEAIVGDGEKKQNFFSSRTQRDYKQRNHIGLGLKGQSALHVSGHSYGTMLQLNTEDINENGENNTANVFRFNNTETYSLGNLYNSKGELIADELSSMMAAILDDIKNPILDPIGINQFTIDTWATIVRAGFGTETAINLITQPVIRELVTKLQENQYQIKSVAQGWNSTDTLLVDYKARLKAVQSKLSENSMEELKDEFDKIGAFNLNDTAMTFWRNWANKNDLNTTSNEDHNKMLAKYYTYQVRVLNNYGRYDKIAKELVKINRFFSINKEIGPNIENIIDKKYLYNEIKDSRFTIKGMENLSAVDGLSAQYDTLLASLDFFNKYFPYDSIQNTTIKDSLGIIQSGKELRADIRMKVNGFTRAFIDNKFEFFADINTEATKKMLFSNLPKELSKIKDPRNDKDYFGGKLRQNVFIEQLKITIENGLGYVTLKGNKLDTQVKDTLSEAIYSLWQNKETHELMKDLIKHSYASTGFFTGLNSFHSLIHPDILSEIGYFDYRKNVINELSKGKILLDADDQYNLMDQIIRNFPKDFTKVFDSSMFEDKNGMLVTNDELIKNAKKASDMFIGVLGGGTDGPIVHIYPQYIRVYDPKAKRSLIYQQGDPGEYHYVTNLGKSGRMIEIDNRDYLEKSIINDNNIKLKKPVKATRIDNIPEDETSNDEQSSPVLESETYDPSSVTDLDDMFGEIKSPEENTQSPKDLFGEIDDLPPLDIDPNSIDNCE